MWNTAIIAVLGVTFARHCDGWRLPFGTHHQQVDSRKHIPAISKALGIALTTASMFGLPNPSLADSRLNAPSAAGTRVNSDAYSLLRNGLPINNKDIRSIDASVFSAKTNMKTRLLPFAKNDITNARGQLKQNKEKLLKAVPSSHKEKAAASIARMEEDFDPVLNAIEEAQAAGPGSLQERKGYDDAFAAQDTLSLEIGTFEELLIPDEFMRKIPAEYDNLPRLTRRATVEFVVKKADGSKFDVDGKLYNQVVLRMVVDGFNAPITAGNFVDLVDKGFYKNMKIQRSDGFVVQTGDKDPDGSVHGYVPLGSSTERTIPLEVSLKGDKDLIYGATTDEEQRGSAAAVLPFQAYGAMGMARSEFDNDSASSQFFWLLFESDLTPAGKNMLDGRYTCFGYVVDGADLLKDIKEGDIITSTEIISGKEFLKR